MYIWAWLVNGSTSIQLISTDAGSTITTAVTHPGLRKGDSWLWLYQSLISWKIGEEISAWFLQIGLQSNGHL